MQFPRILQSPAPEPLTVSWPRSATEVAQALSTALSDRRSPIRFRGNNGTYRLRGVVSGREVVIRARQYVMGSPAGLESMALVVRGNISDRGDGSQLEAIISAPPVSRWLYWAYAMLLAAVFVGGLHAGLAPLIVPFVAAFAASAAYALPRSQRALMKEAPKIARALSAV